MPCSRTASLYEGSIPIMGLGACPLFQRAVTGGDPVRVAICTAALTGPHALVLADVWSGMIVCR